MNISKLSCLYFRSKAAIAKLTVLVILLAACLAFASAQQPAPGATTSAALDERPAPDLIPAVSPDHLYRIGPGDLLDIRILNRPQLSTDSVRVNGRGMIQMPLIEEEIQAACRTEIELAKDIAAHYLEYLRNPVVKVFVKEYQSQTVAIIGAVNSPGRFQLQRQVRLLELLSFAGGPAERAGGTIHVIHTSTATQCKDKDDGASILDSGSDFDTYDLNQMLRGADNLNPFVRSGDIVSLPEAERAFVVGNVVKPSAITLREPVTVSQAIAMAGGYMPDTKSDKIRIIRKVSAGNTKTEILVDLKAINQRRAEDIVLQSNDIVDVPSSGAKVFLRGLVGAIAPTLSRLPTTVVR